MDVCVSHTYQTYVKFTDISADVSDTEPAGLSIHSLPPVFPLTWNSPPFGLQGNEANR